MNIHESVCDLIMDELSKKNIHINNRPTFMRCAKCHPALAYYILWGRNPDINNEYNIRYGEHAAYYAMHSCFMRRIAKREKKHEYKVNLSPIQQIMEPEDLMVYLQNLKSGETMNVEN